jgi:hypothetical protein
MGMRVNLAKKDIPVEEERSKKKAKNAFILENLESFKLD